VDAATQVGNGLAMIWVPRLRWRPGTPRLGHFLVSRSCAVLATSIHVLPGSDHRAVCTEIRLT
jgi:hypothetical protein